MLAVDKACKIAVETGRLDIIYVEVQKELSRTIPFQATYDCGGSTLTLEAIDLSVCHGEWMG